MRKKNDLEIFLELIWEIITRPYGWIIGLVMTGICYFVHVKFMPSPENFNNGLLENLTTANSFFKILLHLPLILTYVFLIATMINIMVNIWREWDNS